MSTTYLLYTSPYLETYCHARENTHTHTHTYNIRVWLSWWHSMQKSCRSHCKLHSSDRSGLHITQSTHTQGLSCSHCLYSFCRFSSQFRRCGIKQQSTMSKWKFWINRVFYKRAQVTNEKRGKFGKASL